MVSCKILQNTKMCCDFFIFRQTCTFWRALLLTPVKKKKMRHLVLNWCMSGSGNDVCHRERCLLGPGLKLIFHDHKVGKVGWVHAVLDCLIAVLQWALLLLTTAVSSELYRDKMDPKAGLSGCVCHLSLFPTPLWGIGKAHSRKSVSKLRLWCRCVCFFLV